MLLGREIDKTSIGQSGSQKKNDTSLLFQKSASQNLSFRCTCTHMEGSIYNMYKVIHCSFVFDSERLETT